MDAPNALLTVEALDAASVSQWDEFVQSCAGATFFHRAGWQFVIETAFGHRCYFLYAQRAGRICGVLPLVHIKSVLFGNRLISTGFTVGGGPVVSDVDVAPVLEEAAIELADELDVDFLEYRGGTSTHSDWANNAGLYAHFAKAIGPDPEEDMLAIPRKQRAMVRKGIKAGLTSVVDDDVERLYPVYAESVRNLGTPVFAKAYITALQETFASDLDIVTVVHEGQAIASVMSFYFRDQVLPYYGGGVLAARNVAGNDFLYWEVMRRAVDRGYRIFDFGRSKCGTGAYSFKEHWGFDPQPLTYEYKLRKLQSAPEINPLNPKYRLLIAAWKRLPLPIAGFIGPHIARNLG